MASRWPDFKFRVLDRSMAAWQGPIRGAQKWYEVCVLWQMDGLHKPYLFLLNPALRPRERGTFEQIPHLLFDSERPALSGLCLFDPNGGEWSNRLLIADTTIPWSAEWLLYYELWHLTGEWLGGGVGYESIAEARAASVYRQASPLAQGETQAAGVAEGQAVQDPVA